MAKLFLSAALAVLLVSAVAGDRTLKQLQVPGIFGKRCDAFSALKITKQGLGRCFGEASAACEVNAAATAEIAAQISTLKQTNDICAVTDLSVANAGRAVGDAIAKSFAQALLKIHCTGVQGFACGISVGNAASWGLAYAQSISLALAEATTANSLALCDSFVQAIGDSIAATFAKAQTIGCVAGAEGGVHAFSEAFSKAFTCVFAEAWAEAIAKACGLQSQCIAQGGGTVMVKCAVVSSSGTQSSIVTTLEGAGPTSATGTATFTAKASAAAPKDCVTMKAISCCFAQGCPPGWFELPPQGGHRRFKEISGVNSCKCFS